MNSTPSATSTSTVQYTLSAADTAWVLISTCLVFIMIPGVGYFYSGITRKKSQLTMLLSGGLALGIVSFEWFLWGFSLSFSQTGGTFIGNLDHVVLMDVGIEPHPLAPTIPGNLYMLYQGMFATITPVLAFGSAAERTTLSTYAIFVFIWSTVVYNFITYWTWAQNGWLHHYGVLDFAGGTPVHLTSGFSAFAYALCVGPRRTVDLRKLNPSNISDVFLGSALLWFGWFGFNGGSELAINARSVNAVVVSNLAAGVGGLTWMVAEMIKHKKKKMSLNGFCAGAVSGFVVITPAAGYVRPHFAVVFGFLAGIVCLIAVDIKKITRFRYDDACDVFAVHGMGGFLGCILTGIFADKELVAMVGDAPIKGGWINGNYIQILYQLLSAVVAGVWSFVLTVIILQILGALPFLRLKLTEEEEALGADWVELGELADEFGDEHNEMLKNFNKNMVRKESNIDILKGYFRQRKPTDSVKPEPDTNYNNYSQQRINPDLSTEIGNSENRGSVTFKL